MPRPRKAFQGRAAVPRTSIKGGNPGLWAGFQPTPCQCPRRHPAAGGSCSNCCRSGSQRHSANRRLISGSKRSPPRNNPRRSQSASPGHLLSQGWRRGSFGSKSTQPKACPPQCGQRSTSQPSLCFSPTRAPQSGQFFIVFAPVVASYVHDVRPGRRVLPPGSDTNDTLVSFELGIKTCGNVGSEDRFVPRPLVQHPHALAVGRPTLATNSGPTRLARR